MSKVKITDFLMTMGNICKKNYDDCSGCPFNFVNEEYGVGCARDFLEKEEIAEKIKRIVIKQMKGAE